MNKANGEASLLLVRRQNHSAPTENAGVHARTFAGSDRGERVALAFLLLGAALAGAAPAAPAHDTDGNGYVNPIDYQQLHACLIESGPGVTGAGACLLNFDGGDGDVDLADFASFQRSQGHLPIPLRDVFGQILVLDSKAAFSGRETCAGSCHAHDIDHITNGLHFQQGRTETSGVLAVGDDPFGDGRRWNFSRGRYGRWVAGLELTGKSNADEADIGITSFAWIRDCGGCHMGSGPGEFDRDGYPYYDPISGTFGFEALGKTWDDVRLDGDYCVLDTATGDVIPARWDQSGASGPDCLFCHRTERSMNGRTSLNLSRRQAVLAAGSSLVDAAQNPVRAFEAAATAAQGWFSTLDIAGGKAKTLEIDYSVGVADGSILSDGAGALALAPSSLNAKPTDQVCAPCHRQTLNHSGVWFDDRDFHFAKLNNRRDEDPNNDIPDDQSRTCNYCHPGTVDHNFAKGNFVSHNWRDDLDWVDFRSCRECHLSDSPVRHPDAPEVPGTQYIHLAMWETPDVLSCQACHIPYGLVSPYSAVFDSSIGSYFSFLPANLFYSADPLDPTNPDKSRWYPALVWKTDSDGKQRLFPGGTIPNVYWGDWDQNGTPPDFTDDTIAPIVSAQVRLLTNGAALPGVTDDNGDGRLEVNRPAEILSYINFFKGVNAESKVFSTRPVLVKGQRVWYEDSEAPDGVASFAFAGTGITMEDWSPFVYSVDHNVAFAVEAWGYDVKGGQEGCRDCHRPDTLDSPVFDRKILVDPYDENGVAQYSKVRELTGRNPP